ncbi:MAG: 3-methyl-2-oxobutanoate hydroxymethyltransferase [Myxococcota bacterium]
MKKSPITTLDLRARKQSGERIVMTTAYDATLAALLDPAVDAILVGDSLGMVVQGHDSTLKVTLEHMVYHTAAVARVCRHAHVVADLPFMSYQVSPEQALRSAGRLMAEGDAHSVKLEGGTEMAPSVERLVSAGIPVMGHIGLTPQSVHQLGGFKVQGRRAEQADALVEDALALQESGAYALVLEMVPQELAQRITDALSIPTIGIGAGAQCDGQVLVSYDLLGLNPEFKPRFVRRYADLASQVIDAAERYASDVRTGVFPGKEHSFRATPLEVVETPTEPYAPPRSAER